IWSHSKEVSRAKSGTCEPCRTHGGLAACVGTCPVLQHSRSFDSTHPRCFRQHERKAAKWRDAHRGGAACDQGRCELCPRAGSAFAADVRRAVAAEPKELPG